MRQMEYLVNSSEMKKCDTVMINKMGLPSMVLMERAALGAVEELYDGMFDLKKVMVICGNGNNGGDGLAVARLLYLKGVAVTVLLIGDTHKCTVETKQQLDIVKNYGIEIVRDWVLDDYTTIVDAIFGIGISRPVEGGYKEIIDRINESKANVLSLDMPSGISADTGKVMGAGVKADKTVTFAYKKIGLVLYPGADYGGVIKVKDIGITHAGFENKDPRVYSYTKDDLEKIPPRVNYSNKGSYGKVLVIAGGINMSGAAYFAAKAAYRMGAGLVKIYSPKENRTILQTMLPEAILDTYDCENIDMKNLKDAMSWASVIIIGPGMGTGAHTKTILTFLLSAAHVPLVIDADGINIIGQYPELLNNHKNNLILTPHVGEMARLVKKEICQIKENLIEEADTYAKKENVICVLKDARTVVTDGSGQVYLNQSGNNGMSTGGSGDVLTGIIAALLAQGLDDLEAARLGVYIHGLAGDGAASKGGLYGTMADDIVNNITNI